MEWNELYSTIICRSVEDFPSKVYLKPSQIVSSPRFDVNFSFENMIAEIRLNSVVGDNVSYRQIYTNSDELVSSTNQIFGYRFVLLSSTHRTVPEPNIGEGSISNIGFYSSRFLTIIDFDKVFSSKSILFGLSDSIVIISESILNIAAASKGFLKCFSSRCNNPRYIYFASGIKSIDYCRLIGEKNTKLAVSQTDVDSCFQQINNQ